LNLGDQPNLPDAVGRFGKPEFGEKSQSVSPDHNRRVGCEGLNRSSVVWRARIAQVHCTPSHLDGLTKFCQKFPWVIDFFHR
jgi:hypothetical protein